MVGAAPAVPAIPYRGIQAFRYADHAIFFARRAETRLLVSLVDVYRGVLLYGDSGTGKSSLVNAGLLPEARELGFEPVRVRVQPRAGEELVIEPIVVSDGGAEVLPGVLTPDSAGTARVVLSIDEFEARVRAASQQHHPLIVFDQFEEILTLFEDEDAVACRHALAELIARLLGEQLPVKLLFAFREDYLGRVRQLLSARPELVDQSLRLGPPSAGALGTIIRGPFERFPAHFERELDPALAERLGAALAERFGSGDVSLSEVQTVCLRLWHAGDPAALLAAKGVQGLLEDDLGEALDALAPDLRAAAIALLSQMVTPAGTRNVVSAADLRQRVFDDGHPIAPALLDEALDRLERESKLVRRERRRDVDLYEITSEFLVPWISQRREELRRAQERRRERRRFAIFGAIGGALLVIAAIVAAVVIGQRAEARRQAAEATSLALAASSVEPLETRPDVALALAYEGYRTRPRPEASQAVIRALIAARRSGLRAVLDAGSQLHDVALSPDGRTLATGGSDGSVRFWSPATHELLGTVRARSLETVRTGIYAVAFSPDGKTVAAGAEDGVRLLDVASRTEIGTLGPAANALAVAFSPDGKTLAVSQLLDDVDLWDPRTRKRKGTLRHNGGLVTTLAFSPDAQTVAVGNSDGDVRLWTLASRTQRARVSVGRHRVRAVAFSPDGRTLAAASGATVDRWDPATGTSRGRLVSPAGQAIAFAFSPNSRTVAIGGDARTISLQDAATRVQVGRLMSHTATIEALTFSRDGATLASASDDGTARLWDPVPRTSAIHVTHDEFFVFAISPDGKTIAAGAGDTVRFFDAVTGKPAGRLPVNGGGIQDLEYSPTGGMLAVAPGDDSVGLWDPTTGKRIGRLTGFAASPGSVAFSPDGKTLVTGGYDDVARLWSLPGGKRPGRLSSPSSRALGSEFATGTVAFSGDGKTIAGARGDGKVLLWSAATREELGSLDAHTERLTFSPDGKLLATIADDRTVRLWSVAARTQVGVLRGHTRYVSDVAFSPDGKTLASSSGDGTVRLWDPFSGAQLGRLTGHAGAVSSVAFTRDGKTVLSAGADGTVQVWPEVLWRSRAELRASVCDVLRFGLTLAEWSRYAPGIRYRRSCG